MNCFLKISKGIKNIDNQTNKLIKSIGKKISLNSYGSSVRKETFKYS